MNVLRAKGIRKSFGRRGVLNGADLEVAPGRLVAVVGENGSGKSTLLRILARDLRCDSGTIEIQGRVGYCPQQVVLDDGLTPDQHLRYFRSAYGITSLARAEELMRILGYANDRARPAGTLSGGTQQKLNLTIALMHSPALLLLDEPYQGFDWETYLAFWELAVKLRDSGTAIVVISHLVYERERFDTIFQMRDGRLHQGVSDHERPT